MRRTRRFRLGHHRRDSPENAARLDRALHLAAFEKRGELPLEVQKLFDSDVDMHDMRLDKAIDGAALARGLINHCEQGSDFSLLHIEGAAIADEA